VHNLQYFVDSGQATVTVSGRPVGKIGEGEFFGEMAFIATVRSLLIEGTEGRAREQLLQRLGLAQSEAVHVMRTAAVTAEVPCRCLEMNVKNFLVAFKDDLTGLAAAMRCGVPLNRVMHVCVGGGGVCGVCVCVCVCMCVRRQKEIASVALLSGSKCCEICEVCGGVPARE